MRETDTASDDGEGEPDELKYEGHCWSGADESGDLDGARGRKVGRFGEEKKSKVDRGRFAEEKGGWIALADYFR